MEPVLQRLVAGMVDDLTALMAVQDRFSAEQLQREFNRVIIERHFAAYLAGGNTQQLSDYGDRVLGAILQQQLDYAAAFLTQRDSLSDAQMLARAALYAGALKASFYRGKHELWQLPVMPSEDSECQNNCKCMWDVQVDDLEELNALAYWRTTSGESCPTCEQRAALYNPLQIRGGVYA